MRLSRGWALRAGRCWNSYCGRRRGRSARTSTSRRHGRACLQHRLLMARPAPNMVTSRVDAHRRQARIQRDVDLSTGLAQIARDGRAFLGIRAGTGRGQPVPAARSAAAGRIGRDTEHHRDDERRAHARLAVDGDTALHRLGQAPHDRQAEAGAAEAAGRRTVGLDEGMEQPVALLGREADAGVDHANAEREARVALGRSAFEDETDRPRLGELQGIAQQVEQDLLQAQRIADRARRHRRRHS